MNIKPQQLEIFAASQLAESLGKSDRLMEMMLERNNIIRAWKRVCANKGAPGVDGMRTDQLGKYLERHWPKIEKDLLNGTHKPLPVRRKEIPKPAMAEQILRVHIFSNVWPVQDTDSCRKHETLQGQSQGADQPQAG